MDPYRTPQIPEESSLVIIGERWEVSSWKKIYVCVMRKFFDLRATYMPQRWHNQFIRNMKRYREELETYDKQLEKWDKQITAIWAPRPNVARPICPVPPPISILE